MAFNFNKNTVVGVAVTPEVGLEVAQVDFISRTVLKYGSRQLNFDNNRKEIADLDIFKETLQDLLFELGIPKGSDIALTIPTLTMKINDYPASLNMLQIASVIEEELGEHPLLKDSDPCVSIVQMPNSTMQFNKVAYTAAQKVTLIEIAMQIKDLGYNLISVDNSVNATLNSLMYRERVNVAPDVSWVLLIVENGFCRVLPMQGKNYIDCFEERISIGEILEDADNYSAVVSAVTPILKNVPSSYLFVVSKTSIISAEELASQLTYNSPIIHYEANNLSKAPFIETPELIDQNLARTMSLDVVGAAINRDFAPYSSAHFNMFNESLGDIYVLNQPPVVKIGSTDIVLSMANMIVATIVSFLIIGLITAGVLLFLNPIVSEKEGQLDKLNKDITGIKQFLKDNEAISSELFDEGDEIKMGLAHNKNIYSYYTIVGTEIPKKVWLTSLDLGKNTTIEGQADNLESIYSFYRNIKDYDSNSKIKLQQLGLATRSKLSTLTEDEGFDTDSILTSMNADFYQFRISDNTEAAKTVAPTQSATSKKSSSKSTKSTKTNRPPHGLEPLD